MTATVTLRRFQWSDLEELARLLDTVGGPWLNRGYEDPALLAEELSQPSRQPERDCYVAEEGGRIVGFLWLVPELPIGRVEARLGVAPGERRRGLGRRLLRRAVRVAADAGARVVHVETPADGRPCRTLLESEGFRAVRTYWRMARPHLPAPEYSLPQEFVLRSFRQGQDEEELTRIQNRAFEGSWGFCPNTVQQIAARVSARGQDPQDILLLTHEGRVVAYNWTRLDEGDRGRTGVVCMTGVDPHYRRRGLGRLVLLAGLRHLAERGARRVVLEVDAANAPARELYLSLGFRKTGESLWYEKAL